MRILLDARLLHGGGVGRYIRALSRRWLREPRVEAIRFLGDPGVLRPWLEEVDGRGIGSLSPWTDPPYSPVAQLRWATRGGSWASDASVVFFPYHDVPLLGHRRPTVATIHDLIHLKAADAFPAWKRPLAGLLLGVASRKVDRVVTVSRTTAEDLVGRWPGLEGKIRIVHPGVDDVFRPLTAPEREEALRRWGALRPFLLTVGTPRPHKNLTLALEVLAALGPLHPGLRLVVAGAARDGRVADLMEQAAALGVGSHVEILGPVSDGELRDLYSVAEVLLYPSLYEGFGLPPLEALACGTPAVASNRGAIPEIVGNEAAPLLDPGNVEAWTEAVHRLLTSDEEGERRVSAVRRRPREYDWDRCAAKTLDVLDEVADTG